MATVENVGDHIQAERDALRSGTRPIKDKIDSARKSLQEQSEEAWDELVESIRHHPAQTLGITLAAGVVVGLSAAALTRRRQTGLPGAIKTLKSAIDEAVSKFK